jgi:hypothetical protein
MNIAPGLNFIQLYSFQSEYIKLKMDKPYFLFLLFLLATFNLTGQDSITIHLLGNTADKPSPQLYSELKTSLSNSLKKSCYLLGTGDYTTTEGAYSIGDFEFGHLKELANLAGETYLLSGDRDWDNNGKNGLDKMKELEKYIQKELNLKKGIVFDKGCPGPKKEELSDFCVLILINSQWFIHPNEKPTSTDNDCDLFNEEDFWEALEDMIDEESNKRIVIAAHHNIAGHGNYSGEKTYLERWSLPLIGHFIADYKKNVGRPQDFSFENYARFRDRMNDVLANYENVIYISGHENTSEILNLGNNYLINMGSMGKNVHVEKAKNQIYKSNNEETFKITIHQNRDVNINSITETSDRESLKIKWNNDKSQELNSFHPPVDTGLYVAGPEYKAGGFRKYWMGNQYRDEWTTPIRASKLWLDSYLGGLVPYAKGGGLQTASLKFKASDGRKYAFRSINKEPEKALDKQVKQTIYRHLVKDLITTQHPYGGLVAAELLNNTDILHINPQLFYLPDQESLGEYRNEFAGRLGTLELKPDSKDKGLFGNVDDIVSTHIMYRKLINEDDHLVDKLAYAKARVFDMWVGDWDRHQDNWKWAAYKEDGLSIYKPIPRDRDHVFSQWEGIIPTLADWFIPNAEHFGPTFKNIKHLNWKARHLDRFVGNELTLEHWISATNSLLENMDTAIIQEAINAMPKEIIDQSGQEIKEKLLSRMKDLPRAVKEHFKLIAEEVNIIGSNKKDLFQIEGFENGHMEIVIYDKDKSTYRRRFNPEYTKRIYIYGLGKKDEFILKLPFDSDIKVRIIGGKGEDTVTDTYPGSKKDIKVYDNDLEDILIGKTLKRKQSHQDPVFNVNEFEYPAILPFIGLKSSSGNRLGIQFTLSAKKNIFNKPPYGKITDIQAIYFPGLRAYLVDIDHRYKYVWGKQDLRANFIFSTYYSDYPFFYGIGNETVRDHELYEDGFYDIGYNTIKANMGLSKSFWQQSSISYYAILEYNNVGEAEDKTTLLGNSETNYFGLGKQLNYGIGADISIDMRNSKLFTRHGSLFELEGKLYNNSLSSFVNLHAHLAKYTTYHLFSPTTFIVATGLYHTIGDAPFYLQSTLGSKTNLRGHVRNRYVDRSAFYYNTEMRVHLGTWRTILAPIRFGSYVFHDNGKVFDGTFSIKEGMHSTYGLGLYFAPLSDDYSFTMTFARSEDRETYFRMDFGWTL